MSDLDNKTRKKLQSKINDISDDVHAVLKKHGFENLSLTGLHFGPHIPGTPCGAPGSGMTWQWDCSSDPCVLVCQL